MREEKLQENLEFIDEIGESIKQKLLGLMSLSAISAMIFKLKNKINK